MKRIISIILILFLTACSSNSYQTAIKDYEQVSFETIEKRLQNESLIVYVGFEDCPYCQKFVPFLTEIAKEENLKIYYVDSSKDDASLDAFASNNGLETVPALIVSNNGVIKSKSVNTNKDGTYDKELVKATIEELSK